MRTSFCPAVILSNVSGTGSSSGGMLVQGLTGRGVKVVHRTHAEKTCISSFSACRDSQRQPDLQLLQGELGCFRFQARTCTKSRIFRWFKRAVIRTGSDQQVHLGFADVVLGDASDTCGAV